MSSKVIKGFQVLKADFYRITCLKIISPANINARKCLRNFWILSIEPHHIEQKIHHFNFEFDGSKNVCLHFTSQAKVTDGCKV